MTTTVFVTIVSNVITIFSLFRLFLQDERTFPEYLMSFTVIIWNFTRSMTTFIAIYNASEVTFQVNYILKLLHSMEKQIEYLFKIAEQRASCCRQQMHVALQ